MIPEEFQKYARLFIPIEKLGFHSWCLVIPEYVRKTIGEKEYKKYHRVPIENYGTAKARRLFVERMFCMLEEERIDKWFKDNNKSY